MRKVISLDIGGAYLNALMEELVILILNPTEAELVCMIDESYRAYLNGDGTIYVILQKALYGCLESAKLWNKHLTTYLRSIGFVPNPKDECVLNKGTGAEQCTIVVYVDDLLITCKDNDTLESIANSIKDQFREVKINRGKIHSYLGMTFNYEEVGEVKITMEGYVKDLLNAHQFKGKAKTPALPYLFETRESDLLDEKRREEFHTIVAKLLYLAKRARPDILTACAYLCTRVQEPTEFDWIKMERCVLYLNGTMDIGIILRPSKNGPINQKAYVDVSFGVHRDGKSHTGLLIVLGEGPIFVKSAKQKIVTKSSTEAEFVGASDSSSQVIWSREFLIHQGYDVSASIIYQDNKSALALIKNGKSNSERTRHINVRYFFLKDRVENGELKFEYLQTEEMIADFLTKPLQGKLFLKLREKLLNWKI